MTAPEPTSLAGQDSATFVQFSFSRLDLLRCRLWLAWRNRYLMGMFLFGSLLFPCVDLNAPDQIHEPVMLRTLVFITSAIFMFGILVLVICGTYGVIVVMTKNRGILGKFELQIRNDALVEKNELNEMAYPWAGFYKIRSSRNYFFLYVTPSGVVYIPKASFPTAQDAERFINLVAQKTGKSI